METLDEVVQGTCLTMCPRKEMLLRTKEKLLHPFEVSATDCDSTLGLNKQSASGFSKIVKEFSRPAAGRANMDPDSLRPAPVLKQTVEYLFTSIVPKTHPAWTSVYEFVFDRLRAVRQDMVIQGLTGADAIQLLEQIIRFHIYAAYRLRNVDINSFDPVINKQHLLECLKRLLYLYQVTPGYHKHRIEMESVYLLDNLGDFDALSHFLELDSELRASPLLQLSYTISKGYLLRDYLHTLRLIWRLPCVMSLCAVNRHLFSIQVKFIEILNSGYSVKNCKFPVSCLTQLLHTNSDKETLDLCSLCHLVDMFENSSSDFVCFNKSSFSQPSEAKAISQLPPLEKLLQDCDLSQLLLNRTCSEQPDQKLTEHCVNISMRTITDGTTLTTQNKDFNFKRPGIGRGRGLHRKT